MRYESYSPRWREKLNALADKVFGAGYFADPANIAWEPEACLYLCVGDNEELAGFALGRVLPRGGLREFLEQRVLDIPADLNAADAEGTLGVIQAIAVDPRFRGNKIGTKLLRAVHDAIVGRGGDKLIVTFKRGPDEGRVDGIMRRLGFEQWVKLDSYWKESCEQGLFDCVHRTNGCGCEAIFYRKTVY